MGRIIGGVVVGFIAAMFAATILSLIFAFSLGTRNMVMPETFEPTTMYIVVMLLLGIAVHYLGAAVANLIGKSPKTVFWYIGLILLLAIFGVVSAFGEKKLPENMPKASMDMSPWIAMFYAQFYMPSWFAFVSPVAAIVGAYLGGSGKKEQKPAMPAPPA